MSAARSGLTSTSTSGPPPRYINVKIKNQDGKIDNYRIKRSANIRGLMKAYCDLYSLDMNSTVFLLDGRQLRANQTPEELHMDEGDEIQAMLHQIGGGRYWMIKN